MTPDPGQTPPVFDLPGTLVRMLDDEDMLRRMLQIFLTDVDERMALLGLAVAAEDTVEIARQSHTVKGASANMGGLYVTATAARLWEANRAGDFDQVRTMYGELEHELDRYRAAVSRWC